MVDSFRFLIMHFNGLHIFQHTSHTPILYAISRLRNTTKNSVRGPPEEAETPGVQEELMIGDLDGMLSLDTHPK